MKGKCPRPMDAGIFLFLLIFLRLLLLLLAIHSFHTNFLRNYL